MINSLEKRVRYLEQDRERSGILENEPRIKDHKHLARVIWYLIHNPRPNDTPAIVKERKRLWFKVLDEQELTDDELAWFRSQD
jgi:predicted DNA-binding protein (MmcQ/YjbR family)